jgi:hypothetical protein
MRLNKAGDEVSPFEEQDRSVMCTFACGFGKPFAKTVPSQQGSTEPSCCLVAPECTFSTDVMRGQPEHTSQLKQQHSFSAYGSSRHLSLHYCTCCQQPWPPGWPTSHWLQRCACCQQPARSLSRSRVSTETTAPSQASTRPSSSETVVCCSHCAWFVTPCFEHAHARQAVRRICGFRSAVARQGMSHTYCEERVTWRER